MSVTNPNKPITKQDLADFYNNIRPYMGGLVTSKAGFTPIGTIISVMGTTAPVNYLACDGTVYNIADYVELANYFNEQFGSKNFFGGNGTTTFAVPDLRGEFLRGTGTNSHTDQGSGAGVGVHQDATIFPEVSNDAGSLNLYSPKPIISGTSGNNSDSNPSKWANNTAKEGRVRVRDGNYNKYDDYVAGSGGGLITSRPTNTSVLFCIATKNFYIDPTLDYSTDEKVVGTWLNGEPLYQKTVTFQTTQEGNNAYQHGIANIDKVVRADIFLCYDGSGVYTMGNISNGAYQLNGYAGRTTVEFNLQGSAFVGSTVYATIQYIKSNS